MTRTLPYMTFLAGALLILQGPACRKFVQVDTPPGDSTGVEVFSSDAGATAAMNGVYSQIMSTNVDLLDGGVTLYAGLSSDELYNTAPNPPVDQFALNTLSSGNTLILNNFWGKAYAYIYQVNAIIQGLQASGGVSTATRRLLTGQALFMRAFVYHYLSLLFGPVPLEFTTNYQVNAVAPRASLLQVDSAIVSDLRQAAQLLPSYYANLGPVLPTHWAAEALLARVSLYQRDWTQAEAYSNAVIDSAPCFLVRDLNQVFLAYSGEAIWQLQPVVPGLNTFEGNDFIPSGSIVLPPYALRPGLLGAFEPGDLRAAAWLRADTVNGTTYYYPYKYKVQAAGAVTENYTMLRLAEQYLIRAEAFANLGNVSGGQADLDTLRSRAGLGPTQDSTAPALLDAILRERRVELFAEWGHRWFDLIRTNRADSVLAALKPDWKPDDTLYPIPLSQLQANTFLTQNPGY